VDRELLDTGQWILTLCACAISRGTPDIQNG
jgi:hypothetical protein